MKVWGLGVAATGVLAAALQASGQGDDYAIFLSGNAQGYLSPCGCSAPMIGGTKRRATAIRKLGIPGRTILLENGGLVKGVGRQDEIKLETFAQMHAASHGAILNLTPGEAALGRGAVLSMARLSDGRLVSASLSTNEDLGIHPYREQGQFLIGGATTRSGALAPMLGSQPVELHSAVQRLVEAARTHKKALLLVLDGERQDAINLAERFTSITLIQYRSFGAPSAKSERIGNVLLASPGDGGKHLVRLVWRKDRFVSYVPLALDPSYHDDPRAKALFKTYLSRISGEQLLEALPRAETPKFAGTYVCSSCHVESAKVWKGTKHSHGLKTLELIGHDRDPDCVECHVVGLASIYGFRSRKQDPNLSHVGCESCHGPGAAHSGAPPKQKMEPIGEKSCLPCHTVENSPHFDFARYWAKVKH